MFVKQEEQQMKMTRYKVKKLQTKKKLMNIKPLLIRIEMLLTSVVQVTFWCEPITGILQLRSCCRNKNSVWSSSGWVFRLRENYNMHSDWVCCVVWLTQGPTPSKQLTEILTNFHHLLSSSQTQYYISSPTELHSNINIMSWFFVTFHGYDPLLLALC